MHQDSNLDKARKLDESALAAIHDEFYPHVYRYVRYRLEDEQVVEDIASEVFLRFLDALQNKRAEIRDARAWLMGTASNLIHDHLRRKYRRPTGDLEEIEILAGDDAPEHDVERNDTQQQVQAAVRKLTLEQQQVISMRFVLEYSIDETARIMRKTSGAVKVLQFRALAALRRLMESGDQR